MPQPTPVTNSRLPWVAIAVWALILALIVGAGLVFAGRAAAPNADNPVGAGGSRLAALLPAADPSASPTPSAANGTNPSKPGNGFRKLPSIFGFFGPGNGRGGPGPAGPLGALAGRGAISITAINGSQLSLKTDDGWTRTIDATGATIKRGTETITVGDLKVGDQIRFRETKNSDGTYKVTDIVVVPARTAGTVKSFEGSILTITLRDGSTQNVTVTDATTYTFGRKAGAKADVKAGLQVVAQGSVAADGTFTAAAINVSPAFAAGQVTAKTSTTITIKTPGNGTATINVTADTTYQARGKQAATLADVAVGTFIAAQGTLAADGSLNATTVQILPNGKLRGPGKVHGPGQSKPQPSPSATGSAG